MPDRHTANPTAPVVSTKRQIEIQLHAKFETAKTGYESVSEAHQLTLKHCKELRLKNHLDGNGNGHQAPDVGTVDLPKRKGTARRLREIPTGSGRIQQIYSLRRLPE